MDQIDNFFKKNVLEGLLDNRVIATILAFLVIINLSTAMEEVPEKVRKITKHAAFRSLVTFLSIYAGTRNLYISVGATLGLALALVLFNRYKETFELINPSFNVASKCSFVNLETLLKMYEGDREKLKVAMYTSGVPNNLKLTDYDAPLIATYLLQNKRYANTACVQ